MAIDKGLYQAPQGLEGLNEPAIEVEIENPDSVSIGIGDMEIDLVPSENMGTEDFDDNLAEYMSDSDLDSLGSELVADFEKDLRDRKEWVQTYIEGLKLLGLKYEERTEPWNGACGVFHPMLTESVVRFQAEAITETFPAAGPVKTVIIGKETTAKKESAERVQADMNYQLTEVMTEYRPEHEKMLWSLPITGSAFKKVYYDPSLGRQASVFIPAEDIVVPYGASNIERAERVTHVMRKTQNDLLKLQEAGFYRDVDLGEPSGELDDIEKQKAEEQGMSAIQDERFRLLEMNVDLNLKGFEDINKDGEETGIALPYVVTIEKGTGKVLAIRRNWYEGDRLHLKRQHFVHYQYIPGFGFYGYGLIHLIGGYAKSATMLIRQLVDAGTLSNLPGGLKSRGLRVKGDDTPIAPGEFRDVDVPSGSIKDNILMLPYKEPSQTLLTLFQQIVNEGRAFASSGDMNVSDMSANAPVGTTLALLERQLKVMGAVQSRMHYSMKQEFKLLKTIIADYAPDEYDYQPEDGSALARKSDYENVDVIPVSDPNASTMAQKVVQYQAALQLAQTAPQLYDLPLLHRQMLDVLGIKNAAKLVPIEDDMTPVDPIQENQNILMGKPVKAFIEQDHKAHIQVHMLAMQDPQIAAIIGQNPQAQALQAAMMAHINEHVGFEYRRQMQERMGFALPGEEETKKLDTMTANEIALAAAKASQGLFQEHSQEAQAQQAQQQMQDPVVQMQMRELEIKAQELQLKAQKQQIEAVEKADRIRVEEARIAAQKEIAAMQVAATSATARAKISAQQELEGTKLGVQIAKDKAQANRPKPVRSTD
jgi:ketosteroid isomerase-like protein